MSGLNSMLSKCNYGSKESINEGKKYLNELSESINKLNENNNNKENFNNHSLHLVLKKIHENLKFDKIEFKKLIELFNSIKNHLFFDCKKSDIMKRNEISNNDMCLKTFKELKTLAECFVEDLNSGLLFSETYFNIYENNLYFLNVNRKVIGCHVSQKQDGESRQASTKIHGHYAETMWEYTYTQTQKSRVHTCDTAARIYIF
jgi:hypothetical protein